MITEDVYKRMKELLDERNWTLYKLASVCNLPHSSLYNLKSRNYLPSLTTLDIICTGFGITICDFFIFSSPVQCDSYLTIEEMHFLEIFRSLPKKHREVLLAYAAGLSACKTSEKTDII